MNHTSPIWIAFYHRSAKRLACPFTQAGIQHCLNVISKINQQRQLVEFVLPYVPAAMKPGGRAHPFLFVSGITNVVYTPFISGEDEAEQ